MAVCCRAIRSMCFHTIVSRAALGAQLTYNVLTEGVSAPFFVFSGCLIFEQRGVRSAGSRQKMACSPLLFPPDVHELLQGAGAETKAAPQPIFRANNLTAGRCGPLVFIKINFALIFGVPFRGHWHNGNFQPCDHCILLSFFHGCFILPSLRSFFDTCHHLFVALTKIVKHHGRSFVFSTDLTNNLWLLSVVVN